MLVRFFRIQGLWFPGWHGTSADHFENTPADAARVMSEQLLVPIETVEVFEVPNGIPDPKVAPFFIEPVGPGEVVDPARVALRDFLDEVQTPAWGRALIRFVLGE